MTQAQFEEPRNTESTRDTDDGTEAGNPVDPGTDQVTEKATSDNRADDGTGRHRTSYGDTGN